MFIVEKKSIFLHKRFWDIWLAQGKRYKQTDGRTDAGWTDIHGGENNICLPQGETYNYLEKVRLECLC